MCAKDNNFTELNCPDCGNKVVSEYYLKYHRVLHHGANLHLPDQTSEYKPDIFNRLADKLRELSRNHYRDNLMLELRSFGVDAELIDRGLAEENTRNRSLGLILISGSPIRWINVRSESWGSSEGGPYNNYHLEYAVPDSRPLPSLRIRSTFKRTFPLFGQVIDVYWKGDEKRLGIFERLDSNEQIMDRIMRSQCNVEVVTNPQFACWLITRDLFVNKHPTTEWEFLEEWRCLEQIADCLLRGEVPINQTC